MPEPRSRSLLHDRGRADDERRGGDEGPSGARVAIVRDPDAAAWLLGPARLRQLEPFLGSARSVGDAAERTGEKPNTVLRRVTRLLKLGLLEVAEIVPRAGRPIRLYRTTADVFFVPFEATGADSLESAIAERDVDHERLLRRNVVRARREAFGSWGTRIYRDARGRLQVQTALSPDANVTLLDDDMPVALSAWRDQLYLDFADAKALQRELFDLVLRYGRRSGAQRYIVHVGLAAILTDGPERGRD
jgi:DNA-binding Lrp family transcriptional regulator